MHDQTPRTGLRIYIERERELDNDVLVTTCYYYTVEDVLLLASLARDKT